MKKTKKAPVKKAPKLTKEQKKIAELSYQVDELQVKIALRDRVIADAGKKAAELQDAARGWEKQTTDARRRLALITAEAQVANEILGNIPDDCTRTQRLQRAIGMASGHIGGILNMTENKESVYGGGIANMLSRHLRG